MLCVFLSQLAHHSSNQLHFNSFCFLSKTAEVEWNEIDGEVNWAENL